MEDKDLVEVTLKVTGRSIEVVNVLLSEVYEKLAMQPRMAESRGLGVKDVVGVETFRQRLLKGYYETFESNKKKGQIK